MKFTAMFSRARTVALVATLALASTVASAAAVTSFSGGGNFLGIDGSDQTVGWQFTVASPVDLTVTSLGFWDSTPADPLGQSHQVGIWTGDGSSLLGSVTVLTTSALSGAFRYEDVTPFTLTAGESYLIGAAISSPFSDVYTVPATVTTDANITLTGSARNGTSAGFSAPTTVTAGNGRIGPNFEFTVGQVGQVPEPSALLITLTGLGLMAAVRRPKRASAV